MLLKILLGVIVAVAAVLLFAATKPSTFHVSRSVTIAAPPEKVYALVADFHNWPRWAPQDRDDTTMQRTYSGAALERAQSHSGRAAAVRAPVK